MGKTRTLPTSFFCKEDADAARYQLTDTIDRANKALSTLRVLFSELDTLPPLADITPQWVESQIEGKLTDVRKLPIPTASKEALRRKWDDIGNRALQAVQAVRAVDSLLSDSVHVFLASDGKIRADGVEKYAKNLATINTTQAQQEHWRLIGNVTESLNKLRAFEKKHGLKHLTAQTLETLKDGEDYLQRYTYGFFTRKPTTEQIRRVQFTQESHGTHRLIIGGQRNES